MTPPSRVTNTSREAYYQHALTGRATSQKDRIVAYLLRVGRPVTRHEIVDGFFHVGFPPRALDGGTPIPWQSAGGRIADMVCREPNAIGKRDGDSNVIYLRSACDHTACGAYLSVDHVGPCPITGHQSEFLVPIGEKWAQRRMFG